MEYQFGADDSQQRSVRSWIRHFMSDAPPDRPLTQVNRVDQSSVTFDVLGLTSRPQPHDNYVSIIVNYESRDRAAKATKYQFLNQRKIERHPFHGSYAPTYFHKRRHIENSLINKISTNCLGASNEYACVGASFGSTRTKFEENLPLGNGALPLK